MDVLLNGREPQDWEQAAVKRGYAHLLERDKEQLAGLLTGDWRTEPDRKARPMTDLILEFSFAS